MDQHAAHERVRLENLIEGKNELNDNPQDEHCNLIEGMNMIFLYRFLWGRSGCSRGETSMLDFHCTSVRDQCNSRGAEAAEVYSPSPLRFYNCLDLISYVLQRIWAAIWRMIAFMVTEWVGALTQPSVSPSVHTVGGCKNLTCKIDRISLVTSMLMYLRFCLSQVLPTAFTKFRPRSEVLTSSRTRDFGGEGTSVLHGKGE